MKIVFIGQFLPQRVGGAEISSMILIKGLRGENIKVYTISTKGTESPKIITLKGYMSLVPDFLLFRGSTITDISIEKQISKILKKIDPDVIHVVDQSFLIPSVKSAKKLSIPLVATLRDYRFFCNLPKCQLEGNLQLKCFQSKYNECTSSLQKDFGYSKAKVIYYDLFQDRPFHLRNALNSSNMLLTVSDYIKDIVKSQFITTPIERIYFPSEFENLNVKIKKSQTSPTFRIFTAFKFNKEKGGRLLINSFSRLTKLLVKSGKEKEIKIVLRIAGSGPQRKELLNLKKQLSLENVKFLGWITKVEVHKEISNSDLVVVPSLWPEPLSRLIIDSLCLGKPVLSSNVGGSIELAHRGVISIFKSGNTEDLTEKLLKLVNSDETRNKIGNKGSLFYEQNMNLDQAIRKHLEIYNEIANN